MQFWVRRNFCGAFSFRMLKAHQEQVDTGSTIHLPFQHFQSVDLARGLAIGPRLAKRRGNRIEIGRETARRGGQSRHLRLIQAFSQHVHLAVADHVGEGTKCQTSRTTPSRDLAGTRYQIRDTEGLVTRAALKNDCSSSPIVSPRMPVTLTLGFEKISFS